MSFAPPLRSAPAAAYAVAAHQAGNHQSQPTRWLPSRGRECIRRGRYRNFCQGPRRVPAPYGEAADLARRLGLGDLKMVSHLMLEPPKTQWMSAAAPAQAQRSLLWPVEKGKMWRGFGKVKRGNKRRRRHKGVDIGAPDGSPIRAAMGGLVAYSDNGVRGYGNLLVMIHGDGSVAFYAHCQALYVFPGQKIKRGQVIGEVGHTGIARGSHLHFEYRLNGRPRDPAPLFVGRTDI